MWTFEGYSAKSLVIERRSNCYITYTCSFKRRPNYFILNLFCPGSLLIILELSAFFISPESADRTSYAATIMLAMFILQSQVLSHLPSSPNPVLAANYVLAEMILGAICTVYAALLFWWISTSKYCHRKVKIFSWTTKPLYSVVDFVMFLFMTIAIISFNFFIIFLYGLI